MSVLIASDHAGFHLKEALISYLTKRAVSVKDLGTHSTDSCHYPQYAAALARAISRRQYSRGILICKSGIGNSIVANRFPGVRAALAYNATAARLSRQHNDSNVLVLGAGFVTRVQAQRIVRVWLAARFEGGRHQIRLNQLKRIEKELAK